MSCSVASTSGLAGHAAEVFLWIPLMQHQGYFDSKANANLCRHPYGKGRVSGQGQEQQEIQQEENDSDDDDDDDDSPGQRLNE